MIEQFESYVKLNKKVPPEAQASIPQLTDPSALADNIAQHLAVKVSDRQALLEIFNVVKRLLEKGLRPDGGRDFRAAGGRRRSAAA